MSGDEFRGRAASRQGSTQAPHHHPCSLGDKFGHHRRNSDVFASIASGPRKRPGNGLRDSLPSPGNHPGIAMPLHAIVIGELRTFRRRRRESTDLHKGSAQRLASRKIIAPGTKRPPEKFQRNKPRERHAAGRTVDWPADNGPRKARPVTRRDKRDVTESREVPFVAGCASYPEVPAHTGERRPLVNRPEFWCAGEHIQGRSRAFRSISGELLPPVSS